VGRKMSGETVKVRITLKGVEVWHPHESDVTKFVNFNEDGFELEFNVKKTKEKYLDIKRNNLKL
jgi:hypothetical protein